MSTAEDVKDPMSTSMNELKLESDKDAAAQAATPAASAEAPAAPPGTAVPADGGEDPEKKAKKAAKAAEKAAKKAKADAKAAAAKAKEAAAKEGTAADSKKAKYKQEAEAKRAEEAEELLRWREEVRATPAGQKKDFTRELPRGYDPQYVEAALYSWWEESGFFKPQMETAKDNFVIVIPPPNVTGALHLGHALMVALEDTLVRWHRMSGRNALWVPGTDHAGIATQTVVEKQLMRERGLTRHDLGREAFVEEVWKWVGKYGGKITNQLRRTGASPDWSRLRFTMDEQLSAAVKEAFLRMHADGIIYRADRLVNWDCTLKTAVSDIEVDYVDVPAFTKMKVPGYSEEVEFGVLTSFAYKLEEGDGEIVVATTRPETMLGDTAVAVHPDDPRYKHLQGKYVVHPLEGRKIPIITDAELVDMDFGTGAVKITPAHDPNDFATGQRHKLQFLNILDDDGNINSYGGQFAGLPRFKARVEVVRWLEQEGLYRGKEGNVMRLGVCSRSKDVIEPVLKPQWWVDCQAMAAGACQAVRDGRLKIVPKDFEAVWFRWLENIRDWCISRQLWWGHRIPAYYVTLEGETGISPGGPNERMDRWIVAPSLEEATAMARDLYPGQAVSLHQDEDVLDTWFSSGLFPFSVFGWPKQTEDLAKFYPTTLLETGHDILFFWVARMVMMGMHLTGKVPFREVYLHCMVRDAHGRKMSKTLGNVIDPLDVIEGISLEGLHQTLLAGNLDPREVEKAKAGQKADFPDGIEECGTDALRFALCSYTSQGRDVNLDIKRVVAYRYWCNKLWNVIRFALTNIPAGFKPAGLEQGAVSGLPWPCRFLLSRLNAAVTTCVTGLEQYDFAAATQALYAWFQYDLCDVFVELSKPVFRSTESSAEAGAAKQAYQETLCLALDTGFRLLHPFMPFVTEELWQRLPRAGGPPESPSIMLAAYPSPDPSWNDPAAEADMEVVRAVVTKARSQRTGYGLNPSQKPDMYILCKDAARAAVLSRCSTEIGTLTPSDRVVVLKEGERAPLGCGVVVVDDVTTVALLLTGLLDPAKEIDKLKVKQVKTAERRDVLAKKVGAAGYKDKTPAEVQAADAEKLATASKELQEVESHILDMERMLAGQQ